LIIFAIQILTTYNSLLVYSLIAVCLDFFLCVFIDLRIAKLTLDNAGLVLSSYSSRL